MNYRAFLMLDGGDESENEMLNQIYSHLINTKHKVLKETKLTIYDVEVKLDKMIEEMPKRAFNPSDRKQLLIDIVEEYQPISEMIMQMYFNIFDEYLNDAQKTFSKYK